MTAFSPLPLSKPLPLQSAATWAQSEGLEAARQLSGLSEEAFQQALSQLEAVLPNLRDRR